MFKGVVRLGGVAVLVGVMTGCAWSPILDEKNKVAYGWKIDAEHYERIPDRRVSLKFEANYEEVDARFYWDKYVELAVKNIQNQGVEIVEDGTPVTITIDSFKILGSSHAPAVASNTASQVTGMLGGGLAAVAAVSFGEAAVNSSAKNKKRKDDGRNFVPILDMTIKKDDGSYSNTIKMHSRAARGDYLLSPKNAAARIAGDVFE